MGEAGAIQIQLLQVLATVQGQVLQGGRPQLHLLQVLTAIQAQPPAVHILLYLTLSWNFRTHFRGCSFCWPSPEREGSDRDQPIHLAGNCRPWNSAWRGSRWSHNNTQGSNQLPVLQLLSLSSRHAFGDAHSCGRKSICIVNIVATDVLYRSSTVGLLIK